MASAWGDAWGSAWGDSWGAITPAEPTFTYGGRGIERVEVVDISDIDDEDILILLLCDHTVRQLTGDRL